MRLSYIINTAALDPEAAQRRNPHRQGGYAARMHLLEEQVLPAALAQDPPLDEILVCGTWKEGSGYDYLPVEPRCRDRRDALWQREVGARHSTGDVLIFGHDDHALAEDFTAVLMQEWLQRDDWDLLVPKRVHAETGEELNNGKDEDYMGSHILAMRRSLWADVSWLTIDSPFWDVPMTRVWRETGANIVWADDLVHYDVEATADEA